MKSLPCSGVFILALLGAGIGWAPSVAAQPAPPRPHIVCILSDNQGWKDVGFHGSAIKTPTLDKLAEGGARLEQFYAQPMGTPSRAALMTGRYPHRYGLQQAIQQMARPGGHPAPDHEGDHGVREARPLRIGRAPGG